MKRLIPILFALFLVGCSDPNYISYVQDNYSVGEVYDETDILEYAYDHCSDDIKQYVYDNYWDEITESVLYQTYIDMSDYEEEAVQYVGDTYYYDLDRVFTKEQITEYAHDFYSPEDIYTDEELLDWYKEYKNGER